ncbi:hypothetical protein V2J09_003166 [Rumex salicifolius]
MKNSCFSCFFISTLLLFVVSVNSQTDTCGVGISFNGVVSFDTVSLFCLSVWQSHNFILRYRQISANTWSFLLSAPNQGGYVAIGFSGSGQMVGSSAIVGWPVSGSSGLIKQYYLAGKSPSTVIPDQGALQVVANSTAVIVQSSRIYLAFQLATSQPSNRIIYSVGSPNLLPQSPSYLLQQHIDQTSVQISYGTGQIVVQASPYTGLKRTHGAISMLAWGILAPLGAMSARYFKKWNPTWFHYHILIQILAFTLGVTGVILGIVLEGVLNIGDAIIRHKILGIAILVLGCLQVTAILARPTKDSKARKYWNWYHHYTGRVLIILAVANSFYGLTLGHEDVSWILSYGLILFFLVIAALSFEMNLRRDDED